MIGAIRRFQTDTQGAVSVDWVVLTAISAAFGVVVLTAMGSGTQSVADDAAHVLDSVQVPVLDLAGVDATPPH